MTVFYRAGGAGWNSTFAGRPAALWPATRPTFGDWAASTGLVAQFPNSSAEDDDPDGDGLTNGAEWLDGTDPTQATSRLEIELTPQTVNLSTQDRTPFEPYQHALYFRSVPNHYYAVESAAALGGAWELQGTRVATTTQTRFVLSKPYAHAFYRVLALP